MDIIAAIATGGSAAAIGVVRLSGEGCFALCDRVFRPVGGFSLSDSLPRTMERGTPVPLSSWALRRLF